MKRTSSSRTYNNRPFKRPRRSRPSLSVAQAVRKEIAKSADVKVADRTLALTSVDYSGASYTLFLNLARGTGNQNEFVGNHLKPTGVTVRYQVAHTALNSFDYSTIRVCICQHLGVGLPGAASVFETISTVSAPRQPFELDHRKDIKILSDKVYTMTYSTAAFSDAVYLPGSKLQPVITTAGTPFSITSGDIFVCVISDDSITVFPSIEFCSRITFMDI